MQEDEVDGMTTMKREIEQEDVGVAADSEGEISTLILPGFKGSDRDKQQNEEKKSCAEHETSAYGLVQELFSMSCADFEVEVCVRCGNRERCEEKARQCLHGKSHGLPKDFPSGEVHNVKVNYGREMRRYAVKDYDELLEAMHKSFPSINISTMRMSYRDSDGDDITVTKNHEFEHAILYLQGNQLPLKFHVE